MAVKKKKNSAAAASAVAAVTAAGVLVGGAFASPDDILNDDPDPVVQTVDMPVQLDDDGGAGPGGGEEEEEDEGRRGVYGAVRRFVKAAPVGVRAVVAVPLWALGTVVIALVSSLWSSVLSPVAATVLGWLGIALMAVLIFAMAVKTAFPNLPLKKILNKHSILTIIVLCFLCGVLDAVLPFFWEDYQQLSRLLKVFGSLICTGVPVAFFMRRFSRRELEEVTAEPVEEPEPVLTQEEKEAAARRLIEELADSVCPKTY